MHNNIAGALAELGRKVGFYVSREPTHHQRPISQGCSPTDEGWQEHADLLLVKDDRKLYVDVCVTRPTTGANQEKLPGAAWQPLISTRKRVHEKHSKYDEIAELNGYEPIAFVCETYGGFCREARQLLRTLASYAPPEMGGEKEFLTHAYRTLSVCLQRGNASLDQGAVHRLHTEDVRHDARVMAKAKYRQRQTDRSRLELAADTAA